MTVAQLFARIGMKDEASAKLAKFEKQVKNVGDTFKFLIGSAVAFGAAVTGIIKHSLDLAVGFKQFEAETGASAEELQRWQAVAGQTNVSTEALSDSVKELASNREKIKLGQGNIKGFQMLGIDPMQDPFKILEDLKTKTAGLPQAMKRNLLSEIGVSSQFLQILDLTNEQFAEMKSNAFVIPQSSIDALAKANASMTLAGKAVQWVGSLIAEKLAPAVVKITKLFVDWIKANKDGIIEGFKKGFDILIHFVTAIFTVDKLVSDAITHTIGWKNAILVLIAVWAAFNRGLLMSPIGLMIAGIILLVAVIEDLYRYSNGQKSAFGAFAAASKPFKTLLDGIIGAMSTLYKLLADVFGNTGMEKMLKDWGLFGALIQTLKDDLAFVANLISNVFTVALPAALHSMDSISGLMSGNGKAAGNDFDKWVKENFQSGWQGLLGIAPSAAPVNVTVSHSGDTQDAVKISVDKQGVYDSTKQAYANRVSH